MGWGGSPFSSHCKEKRNYWGLSFIKSIDLQSGKCASQRKKIKLLFVIFSHLQEVSRLPLGKKKEAK